MINDFYLDSSCYAQYQFEEGYLFEDSRRTNTLTNFGVGSTTGPGSYKEGYGAASFHRADNQYFKIEDLDLCEGFPLKWKASPTDRYETPNIASFCFWYFPITTDGTQTLIAKSNHADKKCFELLTIGGTLYLLWGYSGTGVAAITINTEFMFTQEYWYYVGVSINGPNACAHVRVWNDESQSIVLNFIAPSIGTDIATNDAPLTIGADYSGSNCIDAILDELVIFDEERTSLEFDTIRRQMYIGPLQNSFVDDPTCKALYKFEKNALLVDSISTNNLSDYNTVRTSELKGLYMEGKQSAYFNSSYLEYALILDSALSTGFPLKSGDTVKTFSLCFWFRSSTTSGTAYFVSKTQATSGQRSFAVFRSGNSLQMMWGYNNGNSSTNITIGTIEANKWYHVGIALAGGTKPYLIYRVWDNVARRVIYFNRSHPANSISAGSAPLVLASSYPAGNFLDGYLDEVVIFTSVKTATEIDQIRAGAYQRQLLPAYVDATGVVVDYFRQPMHHVYATGVQVPVVHTPQWRVDQIGIMVLAKARQRFISNRFWSDPNCVACYSFEKDDPGLLVDHIGGNNLTDHNSIKPVQ